MKHIIIMFIMGAAATVHAEPQPPAEGFLGVGAALGGDSDRGGFSAITLELGRVIDRGGLWSLHGEVAIGPQWQNGFETDAMTHTSSRFLGAAGIELRPCILDGGACAVAGIDLGIRSAGGVDAVMIERVGLDLGTRNLRFRPGLQLETTPHHVLDGAALAAGVAYLW